jgi:SnoaL-like domain
MDDNFLKITEFINKSEVTSVMHRYFRALDEKHFDAQHLASIFTAEAKVTRPNGASLIGPKEISASHENSFARFEGSQHLLTGHDISIHGNQATVRVNVVAMHMWQGSNTSANDPENYFVAGGVITSELVQADGRWKISQIRNDVVWRAGGFRDVAQTK